MSSVRIPNEGSGPAANNAPRAVQKQDVSVKANTGAASTPKAMPTIEEIKDAIERLHSSLVRISIDFNFISMNVITQEGFIPYCPECCIPLEGDEFPKKCPDCGYSHLLA